MACMKLEKDTLKLLEKALSAMESGFEDLPDATGSCNLPEIEKTLMEVARKMTDNYPYFHPHYAGQMLKPPHPVARLAYMLCLWINPNNHALDGGRASSHLEKEAVAEIAHLFDWHTFLGHLTGGGTMANLEALWIAGKVNPGKTILASEQAHYTHRRISDVLGLKFESIPCDDNTKMDIPALRHRLEKGDIGTVVATLGTTGTGAVDPLPEILQLKEQYGFRLHADAAYGGYFILAPNLNSITRRSFACLSKVDSIVIDPHKHGLQPYGCGCVLFKDPSVGKFYKHDSPYTYFSSSELHLGEISLECSRPGASAVALWATQKLLPLIPDGEFARNLAKCRRAALRLFQKVQQDQRFRTLFEPELDIVIWAPAADRASRISERSQALFHAAAEKGLHLATFQLPANMVGDKWNDVVIDQESITMLRSCLMKPEHEKWIDSIWAILDLVAKN
jgi:tyrosine decarboxylase/aspartate 1-decarboxylase